MNGIRLIIIYFAYSADKFVGHDDDRCRARGAFKAVLSGERGAMVEKARSARGARQDDFSFSLYELK